MYNIYEASATYAIHLVIHLVFSRLAPAASRSACQASAASSVHQHSAAFPSIQQACSCLFGEKKAMKNVGVESRLWARVSSFPVSHVLLGLSFKFL